MRCLLVACSLLGLGLAFGAGCDGTDPGTPPPDEGDGGGGGGAPRETFQRCTGRPYTLAPDEGWRNWTTPGTTALGSPNHSGKDMFAKPGVAAKLPGKFTYGPFSADLEDEDVLVFLDDCTGWTALGRYTTDSDGRISAPAPALPTGVYEVRFQVAGDRSTTTSFLWVLPAGTRLVVTDIDATLTTSDSQVFYQIFDGSYVPETYPNAVDLTNAHMNAGHLVFYMTGRPYWLSPQTRGYLAARSFAAGPLRVTDSNDDILPTEGSVGAYKLSNLKAMLDAGYIVDYAYGNATTDIYAYLGAGIPADHVWIIGDHAGEQDTHPVTGTWGARAGEVGAMAKVAQPFDW
jgi:hypothetical protein